MIAIADSYFEGIEPNTGKFVPFHPDCNQTANGQKTTTVRSHLVVRNNSIKKSLFISPE